MLAIKKRYMKRYEFTLLDKKWQAYWGEQRVFHTKEDDKAPKYYSLDMFPYPSAYGLHLGNAFGYIASDVDSRYRRAKGMCVLHPMGFDAFGLPAEQYAIEVGEHPAVTTRRNVENYRSQLKKLGLSYDWEREVNTTDPAYYRWTQWIFLQLFDSWYDIREERARSIEELGGLLSQRGSAGVQAAADPGTPAVTATEWRAMDEAAREKYFMHYRLAYLSESEVNWCPALGTVLANDEVQNGFSERGGHPVVRKKLRQWFLRTTAYADRLLRGLTELEWPLPVKEMQRHWIGRSEGVLICFTLKEQPGEILKVFSTRPETVFGVSFLTLAPEHPLVEQWARQDQEEGQAQLAAYLGEVSHRSERERLQETDRMHACFTGRHAVHPFTHEPIPIWVADYVLGSYGTGAVMGVPGHDARDHRFAFQFGLPVSQVIRCAGEHTDLPYTGEEGLMTDSSFLDDLEVKEAREQVIEELEKEELGSRHVCYRIRDAVFSRQRYWGEPFPVYYQDGMPCGLADAQLPLCLPEVTDYRPTREGSSPLGRAEGWCTDKSYPYETDTMPGWAGSSWYFFRYMSPDYQEGMVEREAADYWKAVDCYVGGAEHTTGHLLYARFFTHFLYDRGYVGIKEPFRRLVNQGMILAHSYFVYRVPQTHQFVSVGLRDQYETVPMRVDARLVKEGALDVEAFRGWRSELQKATFILEDGRYVCGQLVEKMSKSRHNAVAPDELLEKYGADAVRLHMLFLGPLTQSKLWEEKGIEGVERFLHKVWQLYQMVLAASRAAGQQQPPAAEAEKAVHKATRKVGKGIERMSFNTCISQLMICLNTLLSEGCTDRDIFTRFIRLLAPFAPHLAEECWAGLGLTGSVCLAPFPSYDASLLDSDTIVYPIAFNGKTRLTLEFPVEAEREQIEAEALDHPKVQQWIGERRVKRVVLIPKKMVNFVLEERGPEE